MLGRCMVPLRVPTTAYARPVGPDDRYVVQASGADLMLLRAGLRAYLQTFEAHAAADDYASHDHEQVSTVRQQVGELIGRLENAGAPPGARVEQGEEAVEPSDGD